MSSQLLEDPRVDPRIKAMFGHVPATTLPQVESREALLDMVAAASRAPVEVPADHAPYEVVAPMAGLSIRRQEIRSEPDGNYQHANHRAPR
jgi:hypothetical protein